MKLIFYVLVLVVAAGVDASGRYYYPDSDEGYSDYYDEEEYSCSKHEEYSDCGTACERTCDTLYDNIRCTKQCVRGCFCQKGYVRIHKGGKCVCESECPKPKCKKPHEVWSECGKTVCEATCADPKKPYHCKAPCFPGCGCKEGYLRDSNGNCVLPKQCEPKCGPHEVWSDCGGIICPPTCEVPFIACKAACKPGCGCKEGYLRDTQTVKCIPKDKCPPKCKGKNEVYSKCAPCDESCVKSGRVCHAACLNPGCYCKPGYLRNKHGVCIHRDECPKPEKCTGKHEVYIPKCGPCAISCEFPNLHCKICRPAGCYCKEGYLRNSKGVCIPRDQCPAKTCKGKHEVWTDCDFFCGNKYCDFLINPVACKPSGCTSGCICKDGYYRDEYDECISEDQCPKPEPKCKGKHEEYVECGPCATDCKNPDIVCVTCNPPGCYCKTGYLRDNKGICVPIDQCPKPECTKSHQVYSECGATECQATCKEPDLPTRCLPSSCISGCICKPGYLLDDNKNCVPEGDCKLCKKKHEVYSNCGPHESCVTTCDKPVIPPDQPCPEICKIGCFCKEGYVRDKKGNCVLPEDCPPKECPKNEYMKECGGFCFEKRCSDLIHPVVCRPGPCTPKCTCKEGFYRNKKGHCVAAKDCPEAQKCPKYEVFSECDKRCDRFCSHIITKPRDCFMMGCHAGCICESGYYRNDQGVCILRDSCPEAQIKEEQ